MAVLVCTNSPVQGSPRRSFDVTIAVKEPVQQIFTEFRLDPRITARRVWSSTKTRVRSERRAVYSTHSTHARARGSMARTQSGDMIVYKRLTALNGNSSSQNSPGSSGWVACVSGRCLTRGSRHSPAAFHPYYISKAIFGRVYQCLLSFVVGWENGGRFESGPDNATVYFRHFGFRQRGETPRVDH